MGCIYQYFKIRETPFAHLEMGSPVPPIYSAVGPAPWRGSELLSAGIN